LTVVELRSRELAVAHLEVYRAAAPGFSNAFPMLGAPSQTRANPDQPPRADGG